MRSVSRLTVFLAVLLAVSMALSVTAFAAAPGYDSFSDVKGHWADTSLRRAVSEGVLQGNGAGRLLPDDPATLSQVLAILTRFLKPGAGSVTLSELGLTGEEWYASAAQGAKNMGLEFDPARLDSGALTRAETFVLICDAFRLIPAEPDYSVLDKFSDLDLLRGRELDAAAAMVSLGLVTGNDLGEINPLGTLSRAEFVTMLYRIVENSVPGQTVPEKLLGRSVISAAGDLSGRVFDDDTWIGCSVKDCDLSGVTAKTVTYLSRLSDPKFSAETSIERLILGGGVSSSFELKEGTVGTLVIAPGGPKNVTVSGGVERVELTADDVQLTVTGHLEELVISGEGCTVSVSREGSADVIRLAKRSARNTVRVGSDADSLELDGDSNRVTIDSKLDSAVLRGQGCVLMGSGRADRITLRTYRSSYSVMCGSVQREMPTGLEDMKLTLSAPETAKAGETVTVKATVSNYNALDCTLTWYVDGAAVKTEDLRVSNYGATLTLSDIPAVRDGTANEMVVRATVEAASVPGAKVSDFVLIRPVNVSEALSGATVTVTQQGDSAESVVSALARFSNPFPVECTATWLIDGAAVKSQRLTVGPEEQSLSLSHKVSPIPYSGVSRVTMRLSVTAAGETSRAEGYVDITVGVSGEDAINTVTCKYAGDYTLQWALDHDYSESIKTAFVNAKGYSSKTEYLLWVNLTYQRVNVFRGSQGKWELVKVFLGGTGAPGRGTPVGVYDVFDHSTRGWVFPTYIVRPVVNFYDGTGYAFHSRLWNKDHTRLIDDSIGYPVSHGCVRMYDEDVQWIYDNIPLHTTVVVH